MLNKILVAKKLGMAVIDPYQKFYTAASLIFFVQSVQLYYQCRPGAALLVVNILGLKREWTTL